MQQYAPRTGKNQEHNAARRVHTWMVCCRLGYCKL